MQAKGEAAEEDLVVVVSVDAAVAGEALHSLEASLVEPDEALPAALLSAAGLHMVADSLRMVPPASEE